MGEIFFITFMGWLDLSKGLISALIFRDESLTVLISLKVACYRLTVTTRTLAVAHNLASYSLVVVHLSFHLQELQRISLMKYKILYCT